MTTIFTNVLDVQVCRLRAPNVDIMLITLSATTGRVRALAVRGLVFGLTLLKFGFADFYDLADGLGYTLETLLGFVGRELKIAMA